ncbi:MAG TPA: DUF3105 domain-containing protein, partial [Candidatus Dormibacteraeota bacterium]|nr:DUF3105 domain-containing protein [Candidatus Dormibacteraeota bacterium]
GTTVFPDPQPSHTTGHVDYPQSPPVGGPHSPVWLNCGVYTAPVPDENAVHSLEHGVVWVTYDPSLTATGVNALRTAVQSEYSGTERLVILSPYPGLRSPVVASAWGVQIRLDSPTDPRLRAFIEYFRDGPETPEHGGRCTGGTGRPADPAGTPDAV